MPSSEPSTSPTKFCCHCAQPFPIESFPYRDRELGTRTSRCKKCNARYMRQYRRSQRAKRLGKTFAELRAAPDNDQVRNVVQIAIRLFGGLNGFVQAMKQQFACAKPGGRVAGNVLDGIHRMFLVVEATRAPERDRSLLSDEDLERSINDRIARLHPDGRRNDR